MLKHCLLLNPVKCYELFVSIPKDFSLKTLQHSCKIFVSKIFWKAGFSEGHHNLHSPRALQFSCSRKHGQGSMRLEPVKAKQSLKRNPKPTIPLVHVFFSSSCIPCSLSLRLKLEKKPIKCLSHSFYFKGSDIKLFHEQLLSGMRTADESLFLSSSVFKAKVPYWKRRLQKHWFCRYSSRR